MIQELINNTSDYNAFIRYSYIKESVILAILIFVFLWARTVEKMIPESMQAYSIGVGVVRFLVLVVLILQLVKSLHLILSPATYVLQNL